jgi:hypothetical protein
MGLQAGTRYWDRSAWSGSWSGSLSRLEQRACPFSVRPAGADPMGQRSPTVPCGFVEFDPARTVWAGRSFAVAPVRGGLVANGVPVEVGVWFIVAVADLKVLEADLDVEASVYCGLEVQAGAVSSGDGLHDG